MRTGFLLLVGLTVWGQDFDVVIQGGHVIDPANAIDARRDVAVRDGRIARVAPEIPAARARRVIQAAGMYVTPGLIDLHTHVFGYSGSIDADETALPAGTTTVVDAGGAGWRTFEEFRAKVIARARTRVLALINIAGHGMIGDRYESDVSDMDPQATADAIRRYRDVIVGIKTAHFSGQGWTAIDRAVEAGKLADVPVMVDDKIFTNTGRSTREKLLDRMRPGDLHTHLYNDRQVEVVNRFNGRVQPWMEAARRRGVLFDLGHGGGSFLWPVAVPAMQQGFAPDTISTDLHAGSIMMQQSDMANCISKLMSLGMPLAEAIRRSTMNPARAIRRYPELGTLGEGTVADVAVFRLDKGVFAFKDAWGKKRMAAERLEPVATLRAGELVFEAAPPGAGGPRPGEGVVFDLLLKGDRVDFGIVGAKVARVAENLPARQARVVADVRGYIISPGLVDRNARNTAPWYNLRRGITTAAAGSGQPLEVTEDKLGAVREGEEADLAVFARDNDRLRCILTVKNGKIVWDTEGLAAEDWVKAGPYSNFK